MHIAHEIKLAVNVLYFKRDCITLGVALQNKTIPITHRLCDPIQNQLQEELWHLPPLRRSVGKFRKFEICSAQASSNREARMTKFVTKFPTIDSKKCLIVYRTKTIV